MRALIFCPTALIRQRRLTTLWAGIATSRWLGNPCGFVHWDAEPESFFASSIRASTFFSQSRIGGEGTVSRGQSAKRVFPIEERARSVKIEYRVKWLFIGILIVAIRLIFEIFKYLVEVFRKLSDESSPGCYFVEHFFEMFDWILIIFMN